MAGYFALKKTSAGKHMFNLHAGNHQVILTSEAYNAKASALEGIESVRVHGVLDAQFERKTMSSGQPYFVLQAANGETLGRSEAYSSPASMEGGIRSVMHHAAAAAIKDLT